MRLSYGLMLLVLISTASAADVAVFTSPDSSFSALSNFLEGASELKIATYTFDSTDVMNKLLDTNANITIIVEKSPVGGFVGEEVLCRLAEHGAAVMLYNGPYRYMHAKYIIKGSSVLVSTENLGNTGFSSNQQGNRGWGIIVEDEETTEAFLDVFYEDLADSEAFVCSLESYEIDYEEEGDYKPIFGTRYYSNQLVETLIAPDAVDAVLDIINSAEKSIYVEQFYIYRYWDRQTKSPNLFLEALIEKARQGIDVKILLDSYWYNLDKNDIASNFYTNQYVNEIAESENLNLESRLADLSMIGVEKLHVKGMIVDNTAFISSINWNENSPRNNREVGIIVSGEAAQYFVDAFMYDWSGEKPPEDYTTLAIVIIIAGIVIVIIVWRKLV